MMNGSLLLFSFFMITDPMTTPNAPKARIAWSILVALITFGMGAFAHVHTAPMWALFALCAITPVARCLSTKANASAGCRAIGIPRNASSIDRSCHRNEPEHYDFITQHTIRTMRTHHLFTIAALLAADSASAFCGFYVAHADATLFNDRSEVILVRDGQRTIITMSNDFKGNVKDFAMVVPVPTVLQQSDIRIVERNVFSALDAYSSPRLVEYWDENPCQKWRVCRSEDDDGHGDCPHNTAMSSRACGR